MLAAAVEPSFVALKAVIMPPCEDVQAGSVLSASC